MSPDLVRSILQKQGFSPASVSVIAEGSNHHVFDIVLTDGTSLICKFAKTRETEQGLTAPHTDTLFGGRLSLSREAYLLRLAHDQGGLPVPQLIGSFASPVGDYLLMEKSPGISFTKWQETQQYRLEPYLRSLRALGRDFAKLHRQISFSSFGDIMDEGVIEPGTDNFATRFLAVTEMRLQRGEQKGAFSASEAELLRDHFSRRFSSLRAHLSIACCPSVMVFTDMHGRNYFVDKQGIPCGYFDLESAQAAPAALEFYGFRFFLFNFYDEETFLLAEESFRTGYQEADGPCPLNTAQDLELVDLLAACRLLELTESYWGVDDPIRSTWGERMKQLLFRYLHSGKIDYIAIGALWRERDGQPLHPSHL